MPGRYKLAIESGLLIVCYQVQEKSLGRLGILGILGDDVNGNDMGAGEGQTSGPFQSGNKENVLRYIWVIVLGSTVGGYRVQDVRELSGEETLVIGGCLPVEYLLGHGLVEQLGHILNGGDGLRRVNGHLFVSVLNRGPKGPHNGPYCQIGV